MALVDVVNFGTSSNVDLELPGLMNFGVIRRECKLSSPFEFSDISVPTRLLRDLFRLALGHVHVDERYYLRLYPDVSIALEQGQFTSPRHHYVEFGYYEDRLPFRIDVDEEYYFRLNPDIKANVEAGLIPSAQVHFEQHGYKEGRLPLEGWSLLAGR